MAKVVPIVDTSLAFDYHYTGEVYALVIRIVFHAPSMDHNLILPFITRFGGVTINGAPTIHCEDHIVNDHSVSCDQSYLRTPLQWNVVVSCFHARVPNKIELHECEKFS